MFTGRALKKNLEAFVRRSVKLGCTFAVWRVLELSYRDDVTAD